jgi:cytochrome P450
MRSKSEIRSLMSVSFTHQHSGAYRLTCHAVSAARDTISSLMSSCIWKCTRYPEVMAKLRSEVDLFEGRTPTYQEIKDMKYMNYMIKEILRLYPPVPFNARVATKDTCLPTGGGPDGKSPVFIKKGGRVVYQVFSTHRRRDIWGADAEEFRPERWEHIRPGFGYLPFNGGPRICPGKPAHNLLLRGEFQLTYFHRPTICTSRGRVCFDQIIADVLCH